jgi:MFS family permease
VSRPRAVPLKLRGLCGTISASLATALAVSVAAHVAVYGLTPVMSLHVVARGGSSTDVGVLFSVFALVAVVLRPLAGAWIDRGGLRSALLPGAALMVLASLGFQVAGRPTMLIVLMACFGVGFGLATMAAAILAASAPTDRRAGALGVYYLAAPVSMAIAAPLGLWLYRHQGVGANFAVITVLGLAAAVLGLLPAAAARRAPTAPGMSRLWSRGAVPLSVVLAVAAMGQSALYTFLPLHASLHGQEPYLPWFFGVYSGGIIVLRAAVSSVADRWGRSRILMPALACLSAGFCVLIAPPTPPRLTLAAVLLAAGSAVLYPMTVALVVERVPERERGVAIGTVSGAWDLGFFAGSLLIAAVVERASHGAGFATAAALLALALASLVGVERRRNALRGSN